jgi:transcriptional regulator with XRE-family HTH domain
MNSLEKIRKELEQAESDPDYVYEQLLLNVNERLLSIMEGSGLKKADLAQRLDTSRAYVTRLLGGPENLTLRTLVKVAHALDSKIDVRISPRAASSRQSGRGSNRSRIISVGVGRRRRAIKAGRKFDGSRTPRTATRGKARQR